MKKTIKPIKIGKTKTPKAEKIIAYDIFDAKGVFVRRYSAEIQGERFAEYAKTFAEKGLVAKPVFK